MADHVLDRLEATIASRRAGDPATSYVAAAIGRGRSHLARKFGEEAVETVVAALDGDRAALTAEAADTLFHLLMLLAAADVSLADVYAELERREGVSGHAEKAARKDR